MAYIAFDDVVKEYASGQSAIRALDGASFTAAEGELSVILGQSGAGKTTALNILGGMDTATSGNVVVGGRDITDLGHSDLITYRRNDIGFVFQFYNLIPNLTALENVELASQICADHFDPAETLRKVGLGDRLANFPAQLSGGEQQRVSIARAIAKKPKLLLCDEPTGALDYETGREVLQLLQDICRDEGMTVLIVTHNAALAPMAHKVIRFRSGQVVSEDVNPSPKPIADIEW
ncbi:MAG: ABC transporter ATP-binding protein [Bifidobacterium sp.]|nr:ABC transporter ATP-binding protein [Bifidobacterium sp.]